MATLKLAASGTSSANQWIYSPTCDPSFGQVNQPWYPISNLCSMVLASTFFIAVGDGVGTLVRDASTVGTGEKVGKFELVGMVVGAAGLNPQEAKIAAAKSMLILRMAGIVFERTNMVASGAAAFIVARNSSSFFWISLGNKAIYSSI